MGCYVDLPSGEPKEAWLAMNGRPMPGPPPPSWDFAGATLPVCLVNNGCFTAAGVCFNVGEIEEFRRDDGRPKRWFEVNVADLYTVSDLLRFRKPSDVAEVF